MIKTRKSAIAIVAFLLANTFVPASALAGPTEVQRLAYEAAPEDNRVQLLIKLAKTGQQETAAALLAAYPLSGAHAVNRTLFIKGLTLKADGNLTGAVEMFRKALANDPGLTLVRSELAETLVELDEPESAQHHLRLLVSEAPSDEAANGIRSFMEMVDSKSPYKFSGYVAIAPSSNVNNGTQHDTVYSPLVNDYVNITSGKAKSGIGVEGGIRGAYSKRLNNDFSFIASGGLDARLYDDPDFNNYGLSETIELRRMFQRGHLGLGIVSSQSLDNKEYKPSYVSYGPRISAAAQLTQKDNLSTAATFEWRDVLHDAKADSTALMINASWYHAFHSGLSTTVFGGYDRIKTERGQTSYGNVSGGLSIYKELPKGITVNLTGRIAHMGFDEYDNGFGFTREDTRLSGSIDLTKRDFNIMGFAPMLSYSYTNNHSNIKMFDYDSHAVDFRLTKEF